MLILGSQCKEENKIGEIIESWHNRAKREQTRAVSNRDLQEKTYHGCHMTRMETCNITKKTKTSIKTHTANLAY